jgi:hypothetical protein
MSADIISRDMKRLQLRTKTIGGERIQKAKDNNEDVAILSMFLPGSLGEAENRSFRCALKDECFHGDYRAAFPGNINFLKHFKDVQLCRYNFVS